MNQARVTLRYAKSLFGLAVEQNMLPQCKEDMQFIAETCNSSRDLSLLLKSPIIKTDKKLSIFEEIFFNNLSPISISFVNIITNKKRESLLEGIANSFIAIYKEHRNIETATVSTAFELDNKLREDILKFIKNHGQPNVELTEKIDEKLIGGAIIRMGNKQLDVSVAKVIKDLRKSFSENLYIKEF